MFIILTKPCPLYCGQGYFFAKKFDFLRKKVALHGHPWYNKDS
nr:MAG TPA: ribosomal protein S28 [Caudoviricetes sp.]